MGVEIDTMEEGGDDLLPTVVVRMSPDKAESDPSMTKKLEAAAGDKATASGGGGGLVEFWVS